MAREDVEQYYNQITADYKEMVDTLKEMEELAAQDIVNPDKVEEIRAAVEPLKNNYQAISWIMFLLNKPNRKSKKARYEKAMSNKMKSIDPNNSRCPESIHNENKNIINTLNDVWTGKEENED